MFNEGYTASSGPDLHRIDLFEEVIRLARFLHRAVPGGAETAALLALMLLSDVRRPARTDGDGQSVPLDQRRRAATSYRHVTVLVGPARYPAGNLVTSTGSAERSRPPTRAAH